jgi:hypothetical protein
MTTLPPPKASTCREHELAARQDERARGLDLLHFERGRLKARRSRDVTRAHGKLEEDHGR